MKVLTRVATMTLVLMAADSAARADQIYWNTWASNSAGSMLVGSTPVTVAFSTSNFHADIANYPSWGPSTTFADGTIVNNAPTPSNGIMQLTGGNANSNTVTFSTPVTNPVMAIWSLGNGGQLAEFNFVNATPLFVSGGPSNEYGGSAISVLGNSVTGIEGNGTVRFLGTYSSLSWTNLDFENWYGFNVGAAGNSSQAVPEPSTALIMLTGVLSCFGARALRRS
jgi:hypothetical protein